VLLVLQHAIGLRILDGGANYIVLPASDLARGDWSRTVLTVESS
jgi:hypothetical protein